MYWDAWKFLKKNEDVFNGTGILAINLLQKKNCAYCAFVQINFESLLSVLTDVVSS